MPWWVPVVSALLAGLIGLGAGLSTVFLTRRFTGEQRHEERLEAQRKEQREVLVDFIDVLDRWGPHTETFAILLSQDDGMQETVKYFETDSGKEMLATSKEIRRVLVQCLLTVVDDELRPLVLEVDRVVRGREDMHKEVLRVRAQDRVKSVGVGIAYASQLQRLNAQMQDAAVRRLSTPVAPPGRRQRR